MKIKAFRGFCGCGTRIRTQTNRVRVCRATITQSRNVHMLLYLIFGRCQALFRFNLFFLKIHLKRSPQSSIISFAIPLLFAGVSEWQTRRTQNPLAATSCGFKSHRRHQSAASVKPLAAGFFLCAKSCPLAHAPQRGRGAARSAPARTPAFYRLSSLHGQSSPVSCFGLFTCRRLPMCRS